MFNTDLVLWNFLSLLLCLLLLALFSTLPNFNPILRFSAVFAIPPSDRQWNPVKKQYKQWRNMHEFTPRLCSGSAHRNHRSSLTRFSSSCMQSWMAPSIFFLSWLEEAWTHPTVKVLQTRNIQWRNNMSMTFSTYGSLRDLYLVYSRVCGHFRVVFISVGEYHPTAILLDSRSTSVKVFSQTLINSSWEAVVMIYNYDIYWIWMVASCLAVENGGERSLLNPVFWNCKAISKWLPAFSFHCLCNHSGTWSLWFLLYSHSLRSLALRAAFCLVSLDSIDGQGRLWETWKHAF